MDAVFREIHSSPFGAVSFHYDAEGALVQIDLPYRAGKQRESGTRPAGAPSRAAVARWLKAFAAGRDADFPGPWRIPEGGPFTRKVYRAVHRIPAGRTCTYGEVAARCGSPGAARAVGQAMASNPLPLLIPCHRVVGSAGLVGFGGGLHLKERLLEREGALATS
ncbi:MAG: methylated-DNA--[protein]-cysteine S-methyltransferase [Planctomycetota bacterium]|jgi:methylated-DNA-[protein]-cysteine S-methyltransferase